MLNYSKPIIFPSESPPQLIVVIDTEEEFDWTKPPQRSSTSVTAMEKIYLAQEIFDDYQIKPCYVIDYPIASQEQAYNHLLPILQQGNCEIGAHLHPWVNPPFDEELTIRNTYPGNLSYQLEYEKLKQLRDKIKDNFHFTPSIYKAGRCGVGPNTAKIMEELGFNIDLSIYTSYDYSSDGGPDFSQCHADPFWFGANQDMLEIPLAGAFVGSAGKYSKKLYGISSKLSPLKAQSILSRLNIVDRLILTPESYSLEEHKKLTRFLYHKGLRTFVWSFHSPSLVPGMTPYTRNKKDLENFLDTFRHFFDFFFHELGGTTSTPTQLKQQLEMSR